MPIQNIASAAIPNTPLARGHAVPWSERLRSPAAARLYVIAALLILWEIFARFIVDPLFSAPPSQVFGNMGALLARPGVVEALMLTLGELAAAFVLAILIGLVIGLAVGSTRFSKRAFFPVLMMLYGIPQVTILPILILTFGIGPMSKIVFGVTHGMFPVIIATVASMNNLKPIFRTSAWAMGASRWQTFRYVLLPHMVPGFFTGLRLAMSGVLIGVLLGELYASSKGIGHFTQMFSDNFDQVNLLGIVLIVAAIAMVFNAIVRRVELYFSRWRA